MPIDPLKLAAEIESFPAGESLVRFSVSRAERSTIAAALRLAAAHLDVEDAYVGKEEAYAEIGPPPGVEVGRKRRAWGKALNLAKRDRATRARAFREAVSP